MAEKSTDVVGVDHRELFGEVLDAYATRTKDSLFVSGMPGIGKSYVYGEAARQLAKRDERRFVDWNRCSYALKEALERGFVPAALVASEFGGTAKAEDAPEAGVVVEPEEACSPEPGPAPLGPQPDSARRSADKFKDEGLERFFLFADYRLAQRDACDLLGLPDFGSGRGYVRWVPPMLFKVFSDPRCSGLLLLDELPQAVPTVQNAAYQLVHDKCCGENSFSKGVLLCGAGNRMSDGGTAFGMSPALANRFNHLELQPPTIQAWVDWGFRHGIDSRVLAYLQFQPSCLLDNIGEVVKKKLMAWASPRSWEHASNALVPLFKQAAGEPDYARVHRKVAQAVGEGKAAQFEAFVRLSRKLDILDILANPGKAKGLELDMLWALTTAIAEHYRGNKKILPQIIDVCDVLDADFAVSLLRMTRRADEKRFVPSLLACKNVQLVMRYQQYLED